MKKALLFLLVCLLPTMGFAEAPAALSSEDFAFVLDGERYALGEPAAAFVSAAEKAMGPFALTEADSCMFSGKDKEYAGDELLIATYPIGPDGADVLETIYVIGGPHQSARGIGIGASCDAVIAAYGEPYMLDYDQMIYALGDPLTEPLLVFTLDLDTDAVLSFYLLRNTGV